MYKKTASEALQEYIDHFEGRPPRPRHYTRQVSDLLSPQPKFKFVDAVQKKLEEEMSRAGEGLIERINRSYSDSIRSTCVPLYVQKTGHIGTSLSVDKLGQKLQTDVSHSGYQRDNELNEIQDELSTLPSPQMSDVELDSDQDTVETDVLVRSYHEKGRGSSESAWIKSSNSTYPKWVDNVQQPSLSYVDPRRVSSVSVLLKSNREKASLSQSRSMDATGLTMEDVSSIDTDAILETSVYGSDPVNMGGNFHQPLFKDSRVQKILDESRKKSKKKSVSSSVDRPIHSAASRMGQIISSPQKRDVVYSERILNKHRLFLNGQYDKSTVGAKSRAIGSIDMKFDSRFVESQSKLQADEIMRTSSSLKNLPSKMSVGNSGLQLSVGAHVYKQPSLSMSTKSLSTKLSSTSDFVGSTHGTALETYPSKSSDLVEINSQRTSGYHSDVLSPDHRTFEDREIQQGQPILSGRRIISTGKRASILRKDSSSTDILMRQPPIGTKVHQRSKTWGYLQSLKDAAPDASSTPIRRPEYRTLGPSSVKPSGFPFSATSRVSSIAGRMPPSSNPHSTSNARSYSDQTSRTGHPGFVERSRLGDSTFSPRSGSSYTNWKSSASTSRKIEASLREEESEEEERLPTQEYVQRRYVADEFQVKSKDEKVADDAREPDFPFEALNEHNRTWPSIERMKERSRTAYMKSKRNGVKSSYSSWTAEKRSIPLRPQNPISVATRMVSDVPLIPSFSTTDTLNRHQTTSSAVRPQKSLSGGPSSRHSTFTAKDSRYFSDDDNMTTDTDLLLSQPPMPIVNASPSVSTISDEDATIQNDSSDSESMSFADLPIRSSSRVSFAPDVSFSRTSGVSPLSKFESTNPRTAEAHLLRNSINKSIQKSNHNQEFCGTANEPETMKEELIDSFIEDCIQTNNIDVYKRESPMRKTVGDDTILEEPRTVEKLKNMLLNLNGIGPNDEKPADVNLEENLDAYEDACNTSEDADSVVGEQSLARAYHHLERLKSLISGRMDS